MKNKILLLLFLLPVLCSAQQQQQPFNSNGVNYTSHLLNKMGTSPAKLLDDT